MRQSVADGDTAQVLSGRLDGFPNEVRLADPGDTRAVKALMKVGELKLNARDNQAAAKIYSFLLKHLDLSHETRDSLAAFRAAAPGD